MSVLNKLADLGKSSTSEDSGVGSALEIIPSPPTVTVPPRSIPSLLPRLQLDQLPLLPGFPQFRGFKLV